MKEQSDVFRYFKNYPEYNEHGKNLEAFDKFAFDEQENKMNQPRQVFIAKKGISNFYKNYGDQIRFREEKPKVLQMESKIRRPKSFRKVYGENF